MKLMVYLLFFLCIILSVAEEASKNITNEDDVDQEGKETNLTLTVIVANLEETLPKAEPLVGTYPHDFTMKLPSVSRRSYQQKKSSSNHNFQEQDLSEGNEFGGAESVAREAADRAEAAEQAQHGAAARAALMAAYRLAEEAKTAAKEAEAVAAAKQYHAAHLSSAAQGAQGRAFAEAAFSAKVSKILHAAEGLEEQTSQQAELLNTAAYAAKSLAEQSGYVTAALRHLHAAQLAAADESRATARQLSTQQQDALEKLSLAQSAANKVTIDWLSLK